MAIQVRLEVMNYKKTREKLNQLRRKSREVIKTIRMLRNEANELCKEYNKINKLLKARLNHSNQEGDPNGKEKSKKKISKED